MASDVCIGALSPYGGDQRMCWDIFLTGWLPFERTAIGKPVCAAHVNRVVCE